MNSGNPLSQSDYKSQKQNFVMNIDAISLSKYDIKRGLNLPKQMSRDLAEEIGIHVGDGCICSYINNYGVKGYKYNITCGGDETAYMKQFIVPLLNRVYGINPTVRNKRDGTIEMYFDSKTLVKFKMLIGLPLGKKDNIEIPECLLNSPFILDFLRGLMDTDGGLCFLKKYKKVHYYPRLAITSKSKKLIMQVDSVLKKFAFKTTLSLDKKALASNGVECTTSRVEMNGKTNLYKWIELVGFSNPKIIAKLRKWEVNGFVEK